MDGTAGRRQQDAFPRDRIPNYGDLEQAARDGYSEVLSQASFQQPATVGYTLMWGIEQVFLPREGGTSLCCIPRAMSNFFWPQPRQPRGLTEVRSELSMLRRKSNERLYAGWDTDAGAVEIEASMLSGRTFSFSIGAQARGIEVKERLADLASLQTLEVGLICDGNLVADEEVLLSTRREKLLGPPPQLQLLRIPRRRILSASLDSTLRLWDADSAKVIKILKGHGDAVVSLGVDWGSQCALSGAHDCTLRLWDLDHGVCVDTIQTPGHPAFCIDLNYGSKKAITGSWDKTVKVWDLERGICTHTLEGHRQLVSCVSVSWINSRVLSGSHDGDLRLWRMDSGACIRVLEGHQGKVSCVNADWGSHMALSGSWDATLKVWDLAEGVCIATLDGHQDVVACVALDWGNRRALSGSWDRTLRLWDLTARKCLRQVELGDTSVNSFSVDWQAEKFFTGTSDRCVSVWDLTACERVGTLRGHKDEVSMIIASSSG